MKKLIKGSLCELDTKDIKKLEKKLIPLIREPRFYCRKCARVCLDKDYLCKPVRLTD